MDKTMAFILILGIYGFIGIAIQTGEPVLLAIAVTVFIIMAFSVLGSIKKREDLR